MVIDVMKLSSRLTESKSTSLMSALLDKFAFMKESTAALPLTRKTALAAEKKELQAVIVGSLNKQRAIMTFSMRDFSLMKVIALETTLMNSFQNADRSIVMTMMIS